MVKHYYSWLLFEVVSDLDLEDALTDIDSYPLFTYENSAEVLGT
jgi:hypothetical protein